MCVNYKKILTLFDFHSAILERQALATLEWNTTIILLLVAFGVCMFLLYSLMPVVMKLSSATAVNISLLTADLYALFAGLFLFQDKVSKTAKIKLARSLFYLC